MVVRYQFYFALSMAPINILNYRMVGNFRGSQFSRFSRLTGDPRKLNPRNKKPKRTHARAITGGVAIVVHAAAQLDNPIDLTAGLLHTSSLLLSFFCTNVSIASFICYSRAISRSLLSTSTIDRSLAAFFSAGSNEI